MAEVAALGVAFELPLNDSRMVGNSSLIGKVRFARHTPGTSKFGPTRWASKQRKYCAGSVAAARALSTKPKTCQAKTTSGPLKIAISS